MENMATEHADYVRRVEMDNITHRDRRSEGNAESIDSLVDVAIALDEAEEAAIENHGGSGIGAGAFLEAIVLDSEGDDPDDASGEQVDSVDHPLFAHLPQGDPKRLRRFIAAQCRSTVWDGHNHVQSPCSHSENLLSRIRGAR